MCKSIEQINVNSINNNTNDIRTLLKITTKNKEHRWKRDENGEIDYWAWGNDLHAGPQCEVCGTSFCSFCYDLEERQKLLHEECVVTEYKCPWCDYNYQNLYSVIKNWEFCPMCGNRVNTKEVETLEVENC